MYVPWSSQATPPCQIPISIQDILNAMHWNIYEFSFCYIYIFSYWRWYNSNVWVGIKHMLFLSSWEFLKAEVSWNRAIFFNQKKKLPEQIQEKITRESPKIRRGRWLNDYMTPVSRFLSCPQQCTIWFNINPVFYVLLNCSSQYVLILIL